MLTTGDVYEVAVTQNFGGSTLINVLHFKCLQNISGAQAAFQTVADDIKEMLRPRQSAATSWIGWKAVQVAGDTITYDSTTCRRSGGDVYEGNFTGTLTGGVAVGAPGPSFQGLVIALKTGLAGRSKRGMILAGGYDNNNQDGTDRNKWAASHITNVQSDVTTFMGKYVVPSGTNLNFGWVVFSRLIASGCKYTVVNNKKVLTHVQAGNQAGAKFDVKTATARVLIAPMGRRKEGVGV